MSTTTKRFRLVKKTNNTINNLNNERNAFIIHYSCESFYENNEGRTARITSIAVREFHTAQTTSFSVHKVAELEKISSENICENYDFLERMMLNDFYEFVKQHKAYNWVHWSMRNINYGFEAIKHRAKVLGVEPVEIAYSQMFDLSIIFKEKYSEAYIEHPRLEKIMIHNNIKPKNWLNGSEEANCFKNAEYVRLHQSTLAKVDLNSNLLKLSYSNKLKTKSGLFKIYGISPQNIFLVAKDNWLASLILFLMSTLFVWGLKIIFDKFL